MRQSPLDGFGVYPSHDGTSGTVLSWSDVTTMPVLLPYLGVETVVKHSSELAALLEVLKGHFQRVTVEELQARHGGGQTDTSRTVFLRPRAEQHRGKSECCQQQRRAHC